MHKDVHCIIYNKSQEMLYTYNVKKYLFTKPLEEMFRKESYMTNTWILK